MAMTNAERKKKYRATEKGKAAQKAQYERFKVRLAADPELRQKTREHAFKQHHGLPRELADEMIEKQGGLCAICQKPASGKGHGSRLHVDHDHDTGAIREMLCPPCNRGLGQFKDDVATLQYAIEYLKKHSNKGTN